MISLLTENMTAVLLLPNSGCSSAAGAARCSCSPRHPARPAVSSSDAWCDVSTAHGGNPTRFSVTKAASSSVFSVFTVLPIGNTKDQRYRAQAGK